MKGCRWQRADRCYETWLISWAVPAASPCRVTLPARTQPSASVIRFREAAVSRLRRVTSEHGALADLAARFGGHARGRG